MRWLFPAGISGTAITAVCCTGVFTPVLVPFLLGAGLGARAFGLDAVLLPLLGVFLLLTYAGWRARQPDTVIRTDDMQAESPTSV
ncbi:MAG: mercury resistance system transport protein MerF [Chloroflexota bacterium]